MNYDPGIDVVVVSYRTPDDLDGFMNSLDLAWPSVPYTVTMVNVAPLYEDDLCAFEWLTAEDYGHDVDVMSWEQNIGYARACNHAASVTNSEVIAFFNADTRLHRGVLDQCFDALMEHEDVGILGPRQVDEKGRLTHAGIVGTNTEPRLRGWQERDRGQYVGVEDVVSVSGSAYFIKRQCWDELTACEKYRAVAPDGDGAFLPTQHYYEETWCSYHARAHAWRVVYFGEATIVHKWHQASPVGGWAEQQTKTSQRFFRNACAVHGISCD